MPPRGGAVAIVGADALGKANDKEVSGDAEEVTQRRSEVLRRRTVAIQALLHVVLLSYRYSLSLQSSVLTPSAQVSLQRRASHMPHSK